jgi:ribose transport system substrate-binding protein
MYRNRNRKNPFAVALGGVALAMTLAACGSSSTGGSASTSTSSTADLPNVNYASAQVKKYSQQPTFTPPGPPVDVAKLKGDSIFNIPTSSSIPFCNTIDQDMKAIAQQAGLHFTEFSNQGSPSQWAAGVEQAISAHANLISLQCGILPQTLAPQLSQARAHHILIAGSHLADVSYPKPALLNSLTAAQFDLAAKLMVDYAVQKQAGKAVDALVVTANEVTPSEGMVSSIQSEMSKVCGPTCHVHVVNVPVTEWATKIQSTVQSSLIAHPNINWVFPIYDGMALYAAPGVAAAGKTSSVHIATYNGTPPALKLVKQGSISMDVDENPEWVAYVNMDEIFRDLAHMTPLKNPAGPLRVIDSANVGSTGPNFRSGFGSSFVSGYRKLWGLGN